MAVEIVENNPALLVQNGKTSVQIVRDVVKDVVENNPGSISTLAQGTAVDATIFNQLKVIGDDLWQSPGGVIYGYDEKFGNRLNHVLDHMVHNPNKKSHTVFNIPRDKIIDLLDEAWRIKNQPLAYDPGAYVIDMKRAIGTDGESAIKLIVKPGTAEIITAYPIKL